MAAKNPAPKERNDGARLVKIKLEPMPKNGVDTKKGTVHPLLALLKSPKHMKDRSKSDLARAMSVTPQSLYKWERLCAKNKNFPLPIIRAKLAAEFLGVKPSTFRPDIFGA